MTAEELQKVFQVSLMSRFRVNDRILPALQSWNSSSMGCPTAPIRGPLHLALDRDGPKSGAARLVQGLPHNYRGTESEDLP